MQQQACPFYYQKSFGTRVQVATGLTRSTKCSPDLFERALSLKPLDSGLCKYKTKHGHSLIHVITRSIAQIALEAYTPPIARFRELELERNLQGEHNPVPFWQLADER